jgi:hypothetical protein
MGREVKIQVRVSLEEQGDALKIMKDNGFENLSQFIRSLIKKAKK